jgi:3-oxoacyl-[acyl-carrier protein] reductase
VNTGLRGNRALVTAASTGLGFAVAEALAEEGCRVVISSSDDARIQAAAARLRERGTDAAHVTADLRRADDCARLVDGTVELLGGLDVLINNTGGPAFGQVESLDDDEWLRAIDLVLMSAVRVSRAALPHLKRDGGGAIVNLTSITAHQPLPNLVLSNALRPGVVALGKTLSHEAAPLVRVNSILTGRFQTQRILDENRHRAEQAGITMDEATADSTRGIPMGRFGSPSELASAAVFLAGDCSSFVTGAVLSVDGGEYAGLL